MLAAAAALTLAAAFPAVASAHASISPPVSLAGALQLYSLAVPTEKSGLTTTKVVLTVPSGFAIDSFAPPPPGWHMSREQAGTGEEAPITRVTWSAGRTPAGEDSLFEFLAQPAASRTYTFQVEQTYSDGSIVNWSGPESSEAPAPAIEAVTSLRGGGTSALTVVALIVGALGLLAGAFALVSRTAGGRPLA